MSESTTEAVTQILAEARQGGSGVAERLLPLVYDELRSIVFTVAHDDTTGWDIVADGIVLFDRETGDESWFIDLVNQEGTGLKAKNTMHTILHKGSTRESRARFTIC